jgi:hypothetical protein
LFSEEHTQQAQRNRNRRPFDSFHLTILNIRSRRYVANQFSVGFAEKIFRMQITADFVASRALLSEYELSLQW